VLRPPEAPAADEPAIDTHGVGPVEGQGTLRRRVDRERVAERDKPGIEGTPRGPQRLLRLQHDRKFREIEAADMNQRAGAFLRGHARRMGKGITHFAQGHQPKRRRQIERGLRRGAQARALRKRHLGSSFGSLLDSRTREDRRQSL
jgi:hypothetical protein